MTHIIEEFKLIGLKLKDKTTNQNNQSGKDCGGLWQKFESDRIFEMITDKLSNEIYAVYFDQDDGGNGYFSYFIGCKVSNSAIAAQNLESLVVPVQSYIKFISKGIMTECLTDTWKEISSLDLPRNFGYDFEVYDERSQDWNDAEVDIYLSAKP